MVGNSEGLTSRWQDGNIPAMKTTKREAEAMTKTSLRLPVALLERVKIRSIKERRPLQEIACVALEAYLKTPIEREGGAR